MEKKTKALVIGGLGAALLLGAGGTFALWFDDAKLGSTELLSTGAIAFDKDENGVINLGNNWEWYKVSNTAYNLFIGRGYNAQQRLVPGDAVKYTLTDVEMASLLTLTGDTLEAKMSLIVDDPDVLQYLTITVTPPAGTPSVLNGAGTFGIKGALRQGTGANSVTFDNVVWPEIVVGIPADVGNLNKDHMDDVMNLDLSGLTLRVEQTVTGTDYYGYTAPTSAGALVSISLSSNSKRVGATQVAPTLEV